MSDDSLPLDKFGISNLSQIEYLKLYDFKSLPNCSGIYLFYFKGIPIYIGKTDRIRDRIKSHLRSEKFSKFKNKKKQIKIYWIKNHTREVFLIERILIRYFKPLLNVQIKVSAP